MTEQTVYYKGKATSVVAPGADGYLEILKDHASLITVLKEGKLHVINDDKHELSYMVTGGFLEVHQNQVSILADAIEPLKSPHIIQSGRT